MSNAAHVPSHDERMTGYQILVVAMCVLINVLDGFDILAVAFAAPAIVREWGLTPEQTGLLLSAGLAGIGVGALVFSIIADIVGRRPVILVSILLMSAGMLAAGCVDSVPLLALYRIVTGLGIGGMVSTGGTLAIEYSTPSKRTLSVALVVIGYPFGATLGGLVAVWLLEQFGWRSIFLFGGAATSVLFPLLLWRMPESIEFLADRRPRGALEKINLYRARLGRPPISELPTPRGEQDRGRQFGELARSPLRETTVLLCVAYAMFMLSFYFIINWATKLVTELGLTDAVGVSASIMINLGGIAGGLLFGLVSVRLPLRPLAVTVASLMALAIAPFGSLPASPPLLYTACTILGFFMWGASATMYSVIALSYPPRVRATGIGLVVTAGRVGSILGPYCAGLLLGAGVGRLAVTLLLALPALVCAVLVARTNRRS